MARNKSYITLLGEFWSFNRKFPDLLGNEARMLYLCLLDIFNRQGQGNQWPGSVDISDAEMAKSANIDRRRMPKYRAELIKQGYITAKNNAKGRSATVNYILCSRNANKEQQAANNNCRQSDNLNSETVAKTTDNTLYNLIDSINKTTSTTTREEVVVVAEAIKEISLEEIYRGFYARYFDSSRAAVIEQLCLNLRVSRQEFENFARACITEWLANGEEHKDPATGQFDEKNASRHLVNHIRIKIAARRREQLEDAHRPKSKEEARRALLDNCLQSTNSVIQQERHTLQAQQQDGTTYIDTDSERPF